MFKVRLGKGDRANVPPLKLKISEGACAPTKTYTPKLTPDEHLWMVDEIQHMADCGFLTPAPADAWVHVVRPVNKKRLLNSDGSLSAIRRRLVHNLIYLNKHIERIHCDPPNLEDIIDSTQGAKFFMLLDLTQCYWQIPMHPDSIKYLGLRSPSNRVYCFTVLPMGLHNSAPHTTSVLSKFLTPVMFQKRNGVGLYYDDLLIYAETEEELVQMLEKTLTLLDKYNFKVHPKKINLFLAPHASGRRFTWAGRSVGADSNGKTVFGVDPEKTQALTEASTPQYVGELMTFLGACGWLRKKPS